uniref:PKD_channel domain-containing protein n=1 Tax=Heterorhabditis bacteriophora TaxID=37862 RepID=A0A1I7XCD2_HETBA
MGDLFIRSKNGKSGKQFEDISSISDIWNYLEEEFVSGLYWSTINSNGSQNDMVNFENKLLGKPKIRMVKSTKYLFYIIYKYFQAVFCFEEYGTKKSSGRPSKSNGREKGKFCGLRRIIQAASLESVGLVALMLQKLRCGEF